MLKLRVFWAVFWGLQQIVLGTAVVFAQTGSKLNPQFQQDLRGDAPIGGSDDSFTMPQGAPPGTPMDESTGKTSEDLLYSKKETKDPMNATVNVNVREMSIAAFLETIQAQVPNIRFVLTDSAQGKVVAAFLGKVTVREALQVLFEVRGLTYQRIGNTNTYMITKRSADSPNLITKIYVLNYISLLPFSTESQDLSAITPADVSSTSGMVEMSGSSSNSGMGGSIPGMSGNTSGGGDKGGAESGIAILSVLRTVLTKQGKLAVEPRTNSLIVTDVAEVFPQIEQIISELDRKAPQVLIESRIMEINSDRINNLGIEWGGANGELASFKGPIRATDWPLGERTVAGGDWKLFNSNMNLDSLTGASALGYLSLAQLTALLKAIVSRSEGKYLGNSKIVTLNNKTAIITISRDAAVSTSSQITQTTTTSTAERRRVGLMLRVTPQVNKEGYITLMAQPSYTDLTPSSVLDSNGQTMYDTVSRGVSTLVRVKNGQTVVIGGLLSTKDDKTVRKVPLLGYIPIVGWFFTSVSNRKQNTDLVLFITPTILVD